VSFQLLPEHFRYSVWC